MVEYRKGEQLEREGDPARWFGFVTEGYFKYVTYGISDDKEHITWFSFEGELLLRRCPGIARHLPLNAIASFLCVTPQQLSRIRKAVTFSSITE